MEKAEQFIDDCTRCCSNKLSSIVDCINGEKIISYMVWVTPDNARRAVEIAKEEMIEKACEWLYSRQAEDLEVPNIEKFINDFRQAMEG